MPDGRVRTKTPLVISMPFTHALLDDVFKSTVHRAINRSGQERYSVPLFFGTDYDVKLEVRVCLLMPLFIRWLTSDHKPLPSCVSEDYPAKYEVVTAGEYVRSRLEATYAHSKDSA